MLQLPGGNPKIKQSAAALVDEHLDRNHHNVIQKIYPEGWHSGVSWELSEIAKLPRVS